MKQQRLTPAFTTKPSRPRSTFIPSSKKTRQSPSPIIARVDAHRESVEGEDQE